MTAKKLMGLVAAVALAVAVASQTAAAGDTDLAEYCSRVDEMVGADPSSRTTSIEAYEAAMKHVKSFGSQFSPKRRELANAWRAVTYNERCSSKSLAYVHAIWACKPSNNPSQEHLYDDARKYAKKCSVATYDKIRQHASPKKEELLNGRLVGLYLEANPNEPRVHFGKYVGTDSCCKPERAHEVVAAQMKWQFPKEAERLKESRSKELLGEFLTKHLYKPCASYVRRMDKMMVRLQALTDYATMGELRRTPQDIQDAVFRFKFCTFLEDDLARDWLTGRVRVFL